MFAALRCDQLFGLAELCGAAHQVPTLAPPIGPEPLHLSYPKHDPWDCQSGLPSNGQGWWFGGSIDPQSYGSPKLVVSGSPFILLRLHQWTVKAVRCTMPRLMSRGKLNHPKNPAPQTNRVWFGPGPLLWRVQPLPWRAQRFLGQKEKHGATVSQSRLFPLRPRPLESIARRVGVPDR